MAEKPQGLPEPSNTIPQNDLVHCAECGEPYGHFIKDPYTDRYIHVQCVPGIKITQGPQRTFPTGQ